MKKKTSKIIINHLLKLIYIEIYVKLLIYIWDDEFVITKIDLLFIKFSLVYKHWNLVSGYIKMAKAEDRKTIQASTPVNSSG